MSKFDTEWISTPRIVVRAYAAIDQIPPDRFIDFFAGFSSADPYFDFTILLSREFVEERINGELSGWISL
jgi:hypothetical protein